jgi:hypothetical protein
LYIFWFYIWFLGRKSCEWRANCYWAVGIKVTPNLYYYRLQFIMFMFLNKNVRFDSFTGFTAQDYSMSSITILVNHSDTILGNIQKQLCFWNMVSCAFVFTVYLMTLQFLFGIYCHGLQSSDILVHCYIDHGVQCFFSLCLCNKDTQIWREYCSLTGYVSVYTINVSTMKHEENYFVDNTCEAHSVQPCIGMVLPFTEQVYSIYIVILNAEWLPDFSHHTSYIHTAIHLSWTFG